MELSERRKIQNVPAWFSVNGDNTYSINHDLDENSVVIDLGGYTGQWLKKIEVKYNPNLYAIEPIERFFNMMNNNFKNNPKFKSLNVGISNEDRKGVIHLKGDETSSQDVGGEKIDVNFITMKTLLGKINVDSVDLLQINIEGDEYDLLDHMIETGIINKIKNIQIQFHLNIDNFQERRKKIQNGLLNNRFTKKYDFPFVWECWTKNG